MIMSTHPRTIPRREIGTYTRVFNIYHNMMEAGHRSMHTQ